MIIGVNKMTVQMLSSTQTTLAHMQLYIELIFRKDGCEEPPYDTTTNLFSIGYFRSHFDTKKASQAE
tara:strand:+ start:202 stop:402 length:201 start_codon:yes stop_codon:yes gene_type:complete